MTKENRIKEIISLMPSLSKDAYRKEELLPEHFGLQSEMINLTYNDDHAENGKLRIWDVENHFEKLNEEYGHVADEELNSCWCGNCLRYRFYRIAGIQFSTQIMRRCNYE